MLNIKPPDYKYCPFCGKTLETKLEEGKPRRYCLDDKWTHYPHVFQASNAIAIKDGKILLVQRNREPYKGKWMFPAGFLEYGEHPKETAIREVREETGLVAKDAVFFDILQTTDDSRSPGNMTFYYKIEIKSTVKPVNMDKEENMDVGWFDIKNLPPIAWKDHEAILKKLQREHKSDRRGGVV
jgi:ADP-ribose pyrophosphatase YjhB (NUDIX family)